MKRLMRKQKMVSLVSMLLALSVWTFVFSTPAVADPKPENLPVIGIIAGVFEIPVSFVKNMAACKGWECANIPGQIGKGILNGAERIVGTSTLGFAGKYNRDFAVNGPIAKNKFASDFVGWGGPFFVYGTASGVGNSLFGVANRQWGWAATGAMVGAGVGGADILFDK